MTSPARSVLAAVLSLGLLFPAASIAQPAVAGYEVRRGDTLYGVARRMQPEGVTLNQALVALYRANPEAFTDGNINLLRTGAVLAVPSRESMAALSPAEATHEVLALTAVKPSAAPAPERAPRATLGHEERERRYREGLEAERRGDEVAAYQAYLVAGEAGHGLAQKKLGEIYDRGTAAVQRDYGTALQWYQKARDQGVEIPRAETRPGPVLR